MIVVADTSPLNYLILIGHADVLAALFERVLVPQAVLDELSSPRTPAGVIAWMSSPPSWLKVQARREGLFGIDPSLDAGEREAISLALELRASALMDEISGRREAKRHGLEVVGTLGILERAHALKMLDLRDALGKLQKTSFYLSSQLIEDSIRRVY